LRFNEDVFQQDTIIEASPKENENERRDNAIKNFFQFIIFVGLIAYWVPGKPDMFNGKIA